MQIKYLHKNIYRLYALFLPEKIKSEYMKCCEQLVAHWEKLHKNKVPDKTKQEILGISKATYYRKKKQLKTGIVLSKRPKNVRKSKFSKEIYDLVKKIILEHPTYGKAKIAVILNRDYNVEISESSVGRILKTLNFPKSRSCPRYRCKRKRKFNSYAKRLPFKSYGELTIGENLQIDHMQCTLNGITVRVFVACEKQSKWLHGDIYSKANSKNAAKFLREVIKNAKFPIKSIQVDGGSEFMKEFEETCKELNIPLYVLPPASPKINGNVERANRTITEEFFSKTLADSLGALRFELKQYIKEYNSFRPHGSLKGKTPLMYIEEELNKSTKTRVK